MRHQQKTRMRQLSGNDARFLYSDTAQANANISKIQIYDQSTAPGGKVRFKSILKHIEGRLDRSPIFRQKLQRVPLELAFFEGHTYLAVAVVLGLPEGTVKGRIRTGLRRLCAMLASE